MRNSLVELLQQNRVPWSTYDADDVVWFLSGGTRIPCDQENTLSVTRRVGVLAGSITKGLSSSILSQICILGFRK